MIIYLSGKLYTPDNSSLASRSRNRDIFAIITMWNTTLRHTPLTFIVHANAVYNLNNLFSRSYILHEMKKKTEE
jgi:hypothetical protein